MGHNKDTQNKTEQHKANEHMRRVIFISLACILLLQLSGCERWYLDYKMEDLCAKDGGMKVYETVTLPASDFNSVGQPLARYVRQAKSQEDIFGPDYKYVSQREYIMGGALASGSLVRVHSALYRRVDNKLLGEEIWYQRSGGDGFNFGFEPSGKNCPVPTPGLGLTVFKKGN